MCFRKTWLKKQTGRNKTQKYCLHLCLALIYMELMHKCSMTSWICHASWWRLRLVCRLPCFIAGINSIHYFFLWILWNFQSLSGLLGKNNRVKFGELTFIGWSKFHIQFVAEVEINTSKLEGEEISALLLHITWGKDAIIGS